MVASPRRASLPAGLRLRPLRRRAFRRRLVSRRPSPPQGAPQEAPDRSPADPGTLQRTCPVCGKTLAERKCKLYCPDPVCGYFLSCSDFY